MKKLILGSALLALAGSATTLTKDADAAECLAQAPGNATPGARLVALSDTAEATSTFCQRWPGTSSDAYYLTQGEDIYLGTTRVTPEGFEVELGGFMAGDELVFYIYVPYTGDTYYTGPAGRNPDGKVHAHVADLGGGVFYLGFEDLPDRELSRFDDVSLVLETTGIALTDGDFDDDGLDDGDDNCFAFENPDQADLDGDGAGDACDACFGQADDDLDADGFCGDVDNCPYDVNDQSDFDWDGLGDACDADLDGDAVIDGGDACVPTSPGHAVDESGCSVDQRCPCEGMYGAPWKNHGGYVRCVSRTARAFLDAGLVGETEKDIIISRAAQSSCGQ
jgi:hypothetical protein